MIADLELADKVGRHNGLVEILETARFEVSTFRKPRKVGQPHALVQQGWATPTSTRPEAGGTPALLLKQAGVAGYALPAAFGVNPGVGEATEVVVGLVLVDAFSVIDADYYR